MIAWLLPPTNFDIHAGARRRSDSDRLTRRWSILQAGTPVVATPVGEVPIRIDALLWINPPDGIDPPGLEHRGVGLPALRKVDRITQPSSRNDSVDGCRHDVVVTAKDGWSAVAEQQLGRS